MTRQAIIDLRHKIEHGGTYDGRIYRYTIGRDGRIYRIRLDYLDTTAARDSWETLHGRQIDRQTAKEIIF